MFDSAIEALAAPAQNEWRLRRRVPTRLKIFHGFGSIAYGVKGERVFDLPAAFYNQVLGMDAWLRLHCAADRDGRSTPF
jgi:hypothetical protein